jgi:hypothetical protein
METENEIPKHNDANLEAKIADLKIEVENLQTKIADLEKKLIMIGGINNKCLYCGKQTGTFLYKGPHKQITQIATIDYYHYKCTDKNCGKEYQKQYP